MVELENLDDLPMDASPEDSESMDARNTIARDNHIVLGPGNVPLASWPDPAGAEEEPSDMEEEAGAKKRCV